MTDGYEKRSYGDRDVGFGEKPAIAVVDFQWGYIDSSYPMGGSELIDAAVENTAGLLKLARSKGTPVASCAMAFQDETDMPHWKIPAMYNGDFFHGGKGIDLDPRIYDPSIISLYTSMPRLYFLLLQYLHTLTSMV